MKTKLLLILLFSPLMANSSYRAIRILCTAALTKNHYEFRKQQYIKSLAILNSLGYPNPYVVESCSKRGPTFLDDLSKKVFYSGVNNSQLKNHGINEAKTMLEACSYFNFSLDDTIIKLTGRYELISDHLFKTVEKDQENFDAFIKTQSDDYVYTLAFAMKYKYLKEMLETIDYSELERKMIPLECGVSDYIKRKKREPHFKIMHLAKLDVKADLFGSSTAPGASEVITF